MEPAIVANYLAAYLSSLLDSLAFVKLFIRKQSRSFFGCPTRKYHSLLALQIVGEMGKSLLLVKVFGDLVVVHSLVNKVHEFILNFLNAFRPWFSKRAVSQY